MDARKELVLEVKNTCVYNFDTLRNFIGETICIQEANNTCI